MTNLMVFVNSIAFFSLVNLGIEIGGGLRRETEWRRMQRHGKVTEYYPK